MMAVPPAQRHDFYNPLEKIEELLTCSICLDRYRNPKLLPCQHTFCAEPCLDGCVDIVKRVLKCPECRAEHSIPYDGVKAFQTNYTLVGFLEIHLQASEDNAAEIEAYIRRYNMERCKVCDEKAEVFYCTHCDKRICEDCKNSHMELIKKDLGRLMNQVKRLSARVTDASDGLSKGMESLTLNCDNTKEEIKDYIRRYSKELKKKEEKMVAEIETFQAAEMRLMRNLRDALELESSNINEACARVDAFIKGERDIGEEDLVFYKNLFSEGLDYLRGFHPDADDLFSKKIRFSVGADPNGVPSAILQFGEIQICSPNFGGRWQQMEQTYLPKCFNLGLESDRYRIKTPNFDINDPTGIHHERRFGKDPTTARRNESSHKTDDEASLRYRRRKELEDEAWNRLRVDRPDARRSPGDTRTHQSSPTPTTSTGEVNGHAQDTGVDAHVHRSPFGQMNHQHDEPTATETSSSTRPSDGTRHGNAAIDTLMIQASIASDRSKSPKITTTTARKPPMPPRPTSSAEENALNERVENIRKEHERNRETRRHPVHADDEATASHSSAVNDLDATSGTTTTTTTVPSNQTNGSIVNDDVDLPVKHYPFLTERQRERQQRELTSVNLRERAHSRGESSMTTGGMDWKKYLIPDPPARQPTYYGGGTASSNTTADVDDWADRRKAFVSNRSKTNPEFVNDLLAARSSRLGATSTYEAGGSSSGYKSKYMQEQADSRRYKYSSARANSGEESSPENEVSGRSADKSDRRNRYRRKASDRVMMSEGGADEETVADEIQIPVEHYTFSYRSSVDREAPRFSTQLTNAPVANATVGADAFRNPPRIDYKNGKGKTQIKFGSKGSNDGEFNWPRGVAITSDGEIAVCDSSNHRMQMFSRRGSFLRSFGKYGSAKGEFDCLAGVASTRFGQLVITDRYNHRIQVFEASTGSFVREFGQHGQTNGRFNNPWGVVVDQQGFIYVCDKDNHRVQIFQADGNFVGKFGTIGNREGQFQNPHFIAVNKHNQLIVTDSSNHRVQVFDHNGHFLYTFGQEGFHDGQFKYPRGVTVDDQGFIIVADSGNNRIQVFSPDGRFYHSFCSYGSGDSQLKGVEAITVDTDGRIIVSDRENHRIQIF